MIETATPRFTYDYATIRDMVATKVTESKSGKKIIEEMTINGEALVPSQRFFTSLFATFGFNSAFWKYFTPDEVFSRIAEVESRDRLRLCIERSIYPASHKTLAGQPCNRLLAVSKPTNPILSYDDLQEKLEAANNLHGQQYFNGIVESFHTPRVGASTFDIGGDAFYNRFVIATPIDGYGMPNVYLMLLREVCSNGAIAYAKAFKSSVKLGKGEEDTTFSFSRCLDQFSNDEGYVALRQRFESATRSWASVFECHSLYKSLTTALDRPESVENTPRGLGVTPFLKELLERSYASSIFGADETLGTPVLRAFHAMTGDMGELYGLANIDAMSQKRQRTMPTKATVYDLLNFATEVATHHANVETSRQLQGFAGTMIASEYDMEGTMERFPEFKDFYLSAKIGVAPQQETAKGRAKKGKAGDQDHTQN